MPRHTIPAAFLLLLIWLGYGNTLQNGFVWDDHELVVRNSDVRTGSLGKLFTSGAWAFQQPDQQSANNNYYRPLQILTYRVVASLGRMAPFPFHVASLLLHCLATLLAYAVFYKLLGSVTPAFVGASIFALHPIHTEAIDWIACSTDLGCAAFLLLSFYCYLSAREAGVTYFTWAASLLAFLAALLWKEMAATLPLLIAAHALMLARATLRKAALTTAPYWLVFAIYLAMRHHALGVFYASQSNWTLPPPQFALTLICLVADYWWKLFFPLHLNAYYVFEASKADNPFILKLGILCAVGAFIIYGYKRYALAAFACLWVFVALLPVLNVYHLGSNVFGERYLYTPSIGFCLLVALAINYVVSVTPPNYRFLPAGVLLVGLLSLYTIQDVKRAQDWTDDFTLFSKTVRDSPRSALVNRVFGDLLRTEKNDLPEAEQHYRQAITLAQEASPPQLSQLSLAYVGLAHVLDETHQPAKALNVLDEAERTNPENTGARLARAVILAENGDWQKSKLILQSLLSIDPNNDVALNTMGLIAWQGEHNDAGAIEFFQRALNLGGLNVTMASTHNNLGAIFGEQHHYDQALSEFHTACELDPQNPEYPTNLGSVFGMMGRNTEAAAYFNRALEIQPGYQPAVAGLAHLQAGNKP